MALGVESAWSGGSARRVNAWKSCSPQRSDRGPEAVDSDPKGPENRPHQYTYKPTLNPEQDTVMASEACKSPGGQRDCARPATPDVGKAAGREQRKRRRCGPTAAPCCGSAPTNWCKLAPRLRPYLRTSTPAWPEIVDAADWLRHDLGVSKSLWGEACLAMGREQAAIALAIVSAKPAEHFRTTPGGYFHGMVAKAKAGELNLARTVWGMRSNGSKAAAGRENAARMNS